MLALALAAGACTTTARMSGSSPAALSHPAHVARGSARAELVDGALAMLGQPYRWGGAAPGGFDCSGLVEYAAAGAGVHLPRTAHQQFNAGVPITRGDIQAGDLIFLHLGNKELHVGIAIDNDRFVHAPSRGGRVRIDKLAAPAYARGYLSARRIIPTP